MSKKNVIYVISPDEDKYSLRYEVDCEPIEIDPNDLKHLLTRTKHDQSRVDAADLRYPILVSTENGKYKKILDGQHRVAKALQTCCM